MQTQPFGAFNPRVWALTHYATKASLCLDLFLQIIVFITWYSHVIIFR